MKIELINNVLFIWKLIGKKRIIQLISLLFVMILSVFAEMLSLSAIIPFLSVLTNPTTISEKEWFQILNQIFNLSSINELVLTITIIFILCVIFAAIVKILLLWLKTRLTASMKIQLQTHVYRMALNKPYSYHLKQNSSDLISLATQKVQVTANTAIIQMLDLIVALILSIGIISVLLIIDTYIALLTFSILGLGYLLIGLLSKKALKRNSIIDAENHPLALKQVQEGIGGIRDIIIDNTQNIFLNKYVNHMSKSNYAGSLNSFISQLPKSILELFGLVLIIILAYVMSSQGKDTLAILGALALGFQKLLPALQQIYTSWSGIIGNQATIKDVINYLNNHNESYLKKDTLIEFNNHICLDKVSFSYENSNKYSLSNINILINKGDTIGFIGSTGSGKSTLLDLIMGLLTPTFGETKIDNTLITFENKRSWQKNISHVPQDIYLMDATIKENIAFGKKPDEINIEKLTEVLNIVHLTELIKSLENGIDTRVGERGVQLSGGQKQRIGIARALYKNTKVLILDEATSALDDKTEYKIIESIHNYNKDITTLMIAHRLTTLKNCNKIFELKHGEIINELKYHELRQLNSHDSKEK